MGLEDELKDDAKSLRETLTEVEETILQTKSKSPQDPLNFPVRLNDKLASLAYTVDGDHPPTAQSREVFAYLNGKLTEQLDRLSVLMGEEIPAFNAKVLDLKVPAIVLENEEENEADEPEDEEDEGLEAGPWGGEGE